MHAAVGRRRGVEQPCNEVTHVGINDFALMNDHAALLQGRDRSKTYPAGFPTSSRPMQMQGGGVRNTTGCSDSITIKESCGKRNVHPQTHKNDPTVPMNAGAEARLFSADECLGIGNIVSGICSSGSNTAMQAQDEQRTKGKDLFFCDDWPQLDSFVDFDADLIRDFDSTFEIKSSYFEDPLWSSICSPDAQLVPNSHFENPKKLSAVASESTASPILKSSVSVPHTACTKPVFLDQINLANPITIQQPSSIEARETCTEEIEHFPLHSDAHLFCPFNGMLVPTSSSMMCSDEIASSSTCSGPELVAGAYAPRSTKKSHDPSHATPDMILDGMAANPLEMYFPPLTAYEQPELLMNNDSSAQTHHLFPEDFAADDVLKNSAAGLQFSSKGRTSSEVPENPRSRLILEAVPVKHLGFQRLQEGMNQLDVGTKTCIRDALYRLANDVEQRHCVTQLTGGSSGANRFRSSVWTETQASSMDRSVALLLLQKPPHRKAAGCQSNPVT